MNLVAMTLSCTMPHTRDTGPRVTLGEAWDIYKKTYLHADGYVLDPSREQGETTSEGQGYALLRAVWMRDERAFVRVFEWTERTLRRADGLYSWRWTPRRGGHILDANTAADADQEIAFALVLASRAFNRPALLGRARELLRSIRRHEAIEAGDGWFPAAGDWAVPERIVNLSYFIPYAYPYFDQVDPDGRWSRATATGYDLVASALRWPGVRLIPDFMTVTDTGEAGRLPAGHELSEDFSSDAMRVFWRIAVDCQLHDRTRACADPLNVQQITAMLARDGALFTRYALDGTPLERTESTSFYGMVLPFLLIHAPRAAQALESDQLSGPVVRAVVASRNRYYDANWVWFGLAAAAGVIVERTPRLQLYSLDLFN